MFKPLEILHITKMDNTVVAGHFAQQSPIGLTVQDEDGIKVTVTWHNIAMIEQPEIGGDDEEDFDDDDQKGLNIIVTVDGKVMWSI